MVIAAILLLVLVAAIVLWLVSGYDASQVVGVDFAGVSASLNGLTTFLLGAGSMLAALLALWMIKAGSARGVRHRRERKEMEKRAEQAERERQEALARKDRADVEAAKSRVALRDAERAQAQDPTIDTRGVHDPRTEPVRTDETYVVDDPRDLRDGGPRR